MSRPSSDASCILLDFDDVNDDDGLFFCFSDEDGVIVATVTLLATGVD